MPVQELLDAVELSSEEITEGIDAVLCNPPYNTFGMAEAARLEHEQLGLKNLEVLVNLLYAMMDRGVHRNIVHSALLFSTLYRLLKREIEVQVDLIQETDMLKLDDPPNQEPAIFEVHMKVTLRAGFWYLLKRPTSELCESCSRCQLGDPLLANGSKRYLGALANGKMRGRR